MSAVFAFAVLIFAVAQAQAASIVTPLVYSAAYATPLTYANSAVGSTHEKVVRSFGGTVSHYSKAVDTPFSSVRKSDTRINSKVYTPKAFTYTAPVAYAAHQVSGPIAVAYSPATAVAHAAFDGFGVHYVY